MTPDLASGQPAVAPEAFQPSPLPTPALDQLVPRPDRDPRNPAQPFASASAVSAGQAGAWGSAHSTGRPGQAHQFDPRAPMATSNTSFASPGKGLAGAGPQFPAPAGAPLGGAAGWAPPAGAPVVAPQPITAVLGSVVRGMGLPLVLCLVATIVLPPISFALLVISAALSMAARVARETLIRVVGLACLGSFILGLTATFDLDAWAAICRWSQILGAISLLICGAIVWHQGKQPPAQPRR